MANFQNLSEQEANFAFKALADETRRAVIKQLSEGEATVSDLAAPFEMALPTFMQHLKVLEAGGLIKTEKRGRVRTCRLEADRLRDLQKWISTYEQSWRVRLDRLDQFLDNEETKT